MEERLYALYGGLSRARGLNKTLGVKDENGKQKSKNQTLRTPYTKECWKKHLNGEEGLGVIPITDEGECNWGAIDIDEYPLDLVGLENSVKELELPFVVLRTKSGGAHVTCYFKNYQSCKDVRSKMAEVCLALGLGNREIYPKQSKLANSQDVGNWLNMPYFNNEETERYAIIDGKPVTLSEFLDYAESIRVDDVDDIRVKSQSIAIEDGPPCLQQIVQQKAGPGERNNVLFNLGVYSRLKDESGWEQLTEQCNLSYIEPPLNHREVGAILKSLEKKSYTFTCNNTPLLNYCNREVCKGRKFGISAFQHIDIGVVLDSVTKLDSDPPIWIVSLDGIRTEIETDELLDQNRFRKVCTNVVNKLPGRMKAEEWDKFVRSKLAEIEIVDAPIETKPKEHAFALVNEYISSIPEASDLSGVTRGRWMRNGSGIILNGDRYLAHLAKRGLQVDRRKLWVLLSSAGATTGVDTAMWFIPYGVVSYEIVSKLDRSKNRGNSDVSF